MQRIRRDKQVRFLTIRTTRLVHCTVLVTLQLTPQARHELARSCIGRNLLSLLLPTTTPHMLGAQDEDSRVECDEMA